MSFMIILLELPFFLGKSSIKLIIAIVAISSLVKNLLTQRETEEENQLNQLIKNLLTQWEIEKKNKLNQLIKYLSTQKDTK